jgi:hypothetical protein
MVAFLRGKGQIIWDVTVDNGYVKLMNFLTLGSRDMFDANDKVVNYLFRALCHSEFDRVHTEHLVCRIWLVLKETHVGNAQVQARMYETYRREYENFTHLLFESIDALFQRFTVVVNNMRANVNVLSVGVLDRQTYQGGTRGSRLCGEDRDRETENSKVCTRTRDTRFIQVRVAKVANPTSYFGIKYGALRLVLVEIRCPARYPASFI